MTQYSALEQQVIALAGVVQAARMVDQVAKTGSYPSAFFEASLRSLFVFDAPSVDAVYGNIQGVKLGLRSVVDMLTDALMTMRDRGNTVIVVEHDEDAIRTADYIIDIGKEGGEKGGYVVCNGKPEKIVSCKDSYTAKFLKDELC